MARISGVDIPREKRLEISLTYIFGIGRTTAQKMCTELDLNPDTRVRDLTDSEVNKIRMYIENNLTTCVVTSRPTSSARSKLVPIRACVTARACRCVVSAPTPTRVPARDRRRPWPTRRWQ